MHQHCQFSIVAGIATCQTCAASLPTRQTDPDRIHRKCGTQPRPTLVRKVKTFGKAVARWIKAGRPVRSPERVAELLAICQDCEHYSAKGPAGGKCKLCGCAVKRRGLQNKLRMATEACPAKPPRWEAEVTARTDAGPPRTSPPAAV